MDKKGNEERSTIPKNPADEEQDESRSTSLGGNDGDETTSAGGGPAERMDDEENADEDENGEEEDEDDDENEENEKEKEDRRSKAKLVKSAKNKRGDAEFQTQSETDCAKRFEYLLKQTEIFSHFVSTGDAGAGK